MFPSHSDAVSVLALDVSVLLVLDVLCRLLDPRKTFDRILFGGLTGVLLLTYAGWRWHETLPSFELTMGALWSYLFFTFEAVAILYTFMSIIILFRAKDRSKQASVAEARLMQSGAWPPVDIFIARTTSRWKSSRSRSSRHRRSTILRRPYGFLTTRGGHGCANTAMMWEPPTSRDRTTRVPRAAI